ncbi:MAG: cell division protein FtsL [Bacilli bacterium]|nr:cell division protein FtsL [Bacilli bacterium]
MAKKKGKRLKLLKGEKFMVIVVIPMLFALMQILNVYTSSVITKTNIEVEELKMSIQKQKEENESLSMQIDELASLDNIQEVAKEYGLSYNNSNILKIK